MKLDFVVFTKPQPQGSMKAAGRSRFGRTHLTSDNKSLKPFREMCAWECLRKMTELGSTKPMFTHHVPVKISLFFYLVAPKSRPMKRVLPVVKPDLDKLQRAVFDALSGVAYWDDAQIVAVQAWKKYGEEAYVRIIVEEAVTTSTHH